MEIVNIFLKVLTQYFIEVLNEEKENSNFGNYHIPKDNLFFYLNDLEYYFKESELLRICNQYFTKINLKIKNKVLKKYPKLKVYFKEHFWKKPKTYILKTTKAHNLQTLHFNNPNQLIFSENMHNSKPTTSGYRSPGTQSCQNLPISSRCNSPLSEENIDFSRILQNVPVESRAGSPILEDNIPFNDQRNYSREHKTRSRKQRCSSKEQLYNLRKKKTFTIQNNAQPKRKYNKRIKTYPYLNQLPDILPSLKPNEATLLLKAKDESELYDLNVPLPICKTVFRQCRGKNPVTKRYSAIEDDGSENIPFHITLKY